MLPGKRDFYCCCKARHSASHVNKEFWQQFQNYAPPSLRVIRTKFARTIINIYYNNIYIRDSQLNRPESVSLASLDRQLYIVRANFVLITRKEGGCNFEIAARTLCLRVCGATPRFTAAVNIPLPRQHFSSRIFSIESSLKAISSDYGSNKEY